MKTVKVLLLALFAPLDFKLDAYSPLKPLTKNESLKQLVQRENGGAQSAFESRLIWAKDSWIKDKWAITDHQSSVGKILF